MRPYKGIGNISALGNEIPFLFEVNDILEHKTERETNSFISGLDTYLGWLR